MHFKISLLFPASADLRPEKQHRRRASSDFPLCPTAVSGSSWRSPHDALYVQQLWQGPLTSTGLWSSSDSPLKLKTPCVPGETKHPKEFYRSYIMITAGLNVFLATWSSHVCQHLWLMAESLQFLLPWWHCLPFCTQISLCLALLQIHVITFRAHLESPTNSLHLKILPFITSAKSFCHRS